MSDRLNPNEISMTVRSSGYTLCYKLIKNDKVCPVSYSFFVSVENEDLNHYDETLIRNVTSSEETAMEILRLITEGTVTPITLRDVLEDIL